MSVVQAPLPLPLPLLAPLLLAHASAMMVAGGGRRSLGRGRLAAGRLSRGLLVVGEVAGHGEREGRAPLRSVSLGRRRDVRVQLLSVSAVARESVLREYAGAERWARGRGPPLGPLASLRQRLLLTRVGGHRHFPEHYPALASHAQTSTSVGAYPNL